MAGKIAQSCTNFEWPEHNVYLSSDLNSYGQPPFNPAIFHPSSNFGQGSYNSFKLATKNVWAVRSQNANSFFEDYYFRIHIFPEIIDLGDLLSVQAKNLEIWNSNFTNDTLTTIDSTGVDGITMDKPEPLPTVFKPLELKVYVLNIDVKGAPIIDASYTFNFTTGSIGSFIIGRRVVLWPFMPQRNHTEVLEWKTDIIASFKNEQRLGLRNAPRQILDYTYQLTEREFSKAKAINTQWAHRVFGIPVWSQISYIGTISTGAGEVFIDTQNADYRDEDIIIVWESNKNYEALETKTVFSNKITLKQPCIGDYKKAFVAPVRYARAMNGIDYTRINAPIIKAQSKFTVTNNIDIGESSGYDQYRNIDVIPEKTILIKDIQEKISRSVDVFDNGSGPIQVDVKNNWVHSTSNIAFDSLSRGASWIARKWIYSRKGKQKSFWLPSWNNDLHLISDASSADGELVCESISYDLYYESTDILIKLYDGRKVYRRILNGTVNQAGYNVLNLEGSVGLDIAISDVEYISLMQHVRFNTDSIRISHGDANHASITIGVVNTPEL